MTSVPASTYRPIRCRKPSTRPRPATASSQRIGVAADDFAPARGLRTACGLEPALPRRPALVGTRESEEGQRSPTRDGPVQDLCMSRCVSRRAEGAYCLPDDRHAVFGAGSVCVPGQEQIGGGFGRRGRVIVGTSEDAIGVTTSHPSCRLRSRRRPCRCTPLRAPPDAGQPQPSRGACRGLPRCWLRPWPPTP